MPSHACLESYSIKVRLWFWKWRMWNKRDLIWGINPHFDFLKTIRDSPNSGEALLKQYLWSEGIYLKILCVAITSKGKMCKSSNIRFTDIVPAEPKGISSTQHIYRWAQPLGRNSGRLNEKMPCPFLLTRNLRNRRLGTTEEIIWKTSNPTVTYHPQGVERYSFLSLFLFFYNSSTQRSVMMADQKVSVLLSVYH